MTKTGKLIIFCAPSGSGKSTLVQWLMATPVSYTHLTLPTNRVV